MNSTANEKKETAEKTLQNIQEAFLNNARRDRALVTLYLLGGVKLTGRIRSFDKYSLILENNHQEQLIFKHAISTVIVNKPAPALPAPAAGAEE
ncbi:MAG: RNA chaperone Hfq [Terriglobia bacterium]